MTEHLRIWRYRIKPGCRHEFVRQYSGEGAWAQLFRRAGGYLGTTLWRDADDEDVYFTLDRWQSEQDFETFQEKFHSVYVQMDRQFEDLTAEEELVCTLNQAQ